MAIYDLISENDESTVVAEFVDVGDWYLFHEGRGKKEEG